MSHVRQQIRDAVVTLITGLSTTGARVFNTRTHNITHNELPCLVVYVTEESSEIDTIGFPRGLERNASLMVEAIAKGVSGVEDTLDTICAEVENAIGANPQLSNVAKSINISGTTLDYEDGDQPIARAVMSFDVQYRTVESDAETAV